LGLQSSLVRRALVSCSVLIGLSTNCPSFPQREVLIKQHCDAREDYILVRLGVLNCSRVTQCLELNVFADGLIKLSCDADGGRVAGIRFPNQLKSLSMFLVHSPFSPTGDDLLVERVKFEIVRVVQFE
jgi:hypothetical protein